MARLHHEGRGLYQVQPARLLLWLGLFFFLAVTLIVLDQARRLGPIENFAGRFFTPAQQTLTEKTDPIFGFVSTLREIGQLRADNARLTSQVQQLEMQNAELQRAESQNVAMRAQLNYAKASPQFKLLPANVVGKDLHGLDDYIEINRGSADGITKGMTVVSPEGYLVGRVASLTADRSHILIITNPSSSVAAVVTSAAGQTEDVVDGKLHGRLVMSNLPHDVKVQAGDNVLTSGLGQNFPKGIKIGQLATVKNSDVELFAQAEVAPYCDFGKLSAVEVITNNVPSD